MKNLNTIYKEYWNKNRKKKTIKNKIKNMKSNNKKILDYKKIKPKTL